MSVEQAAPVSQDAVVDSQATAAAIDEQPPGGFAQALWEKLRSLPPEEQQAVLDYAESLQQKNAPPRPQLSFIGMFADQGVHITEEEIAEARREMWGNFPREAA